MVSWVELSSFMKAIALHRPMKKGFTLIELMLSVGVIAILLMITVPVMQRYLARSDMDVLTNVIVQDLYRAQSLARAGENNASWGVYVQNGSITLFQGASYATRNQVKDELYTISSGVQVTGKNEYNFTIFTGNPVSSGSTTLTNNSDVKVVSVSARGVVDY